jgi:hypothetical protein
MEAQMKVLTLGRVKSGVRVERGGKLLGQLVKRPGGVRFVPSSKGPIHVEEMVLIATYASEM